MRIPDTSFEIAVAGVKSKAKRLAPCPACGTNSWLLDQEIYQLPSFSPASPANAPVYPVAMLVCSSCGHLRLFSAISLGLVKPDGSPVFA